MGFFSTSLKKADTIKIPFIETESIYFYGFKASKQTVFIFITRIIFTKQNHQDKWRNDTKANKLHTPLPFIQLTFGSQLMHYILENTYNLSVQIPHPFKQRKF